MAEWREQAVILRLGHFRESNIWIRALLRERGLTTLFAFGGARSRRRFSGCLDQFNTIDCQIKSSRGGVYNSLAEAALVAAPRRLRSDWRRMGMAANCLRFTEACGIGPENATESCELLENLRLHLESDAPLAPALPLFFRLRLANILGYGPDFSSCANCGDKIGEYGWFLPGEGQTLCPPCSLAQRRLPQQPAIRLHRPSLDLLTSVRQSSPCAWSGAPIDAADLRQACKAIDGLVQFHLGLEWHEGNFRRI